MTDPNRNVLWARILVEELAAAGVETVCVSPGSRSTPLTYACTEASDVEVVSLLDERSAAFFALGHARRTGRPTALVCTSGTAAANYHPAVIEADQSRVPLVALTADRPPELADSGANQTVPQDDLYGDAVRFGRTLPEPEATERKVRSLRVAACRAVAAARGPPAGPVHLNVPFRKPLEPIEVPGDVPGEFTVGGSLAADGREGPFVDVTAGESRPSAATVDSLASRIDAADRGLIVLGPSNAPTPAREALAALADATAFPVLADPLSGHRFGPHVEGRPVCGGYDSYLDGADDWPDQDLVLRFGASPTSKVLRNYLADAAATQVLVDPAGEWREAAFTAGEQIAADPTRVAAALAERVSAAGTSAWRERFEAAEADYWSLVEAEAADHEFEGGIVADVAAGLPARATLFVSNSMPVRDLDRFGRPRGVDATVLGNRGASGIDGIVSTGLGAGFGSDEPLVLLVGDLAYYHDMNGLLALDRADVDATIVVLNNDGGGIFHVLPIEAFDPPFTEQFKTPHGLDFRATGDLYDLSFERFRDREAFRAAFDRSIDSPGTQVLEAVVDAEESHRFRERLHERVCDRIG